MNVIFHASAGTGKTYQVTHLYVSLVLGRRFETKTAEGKTIVLHDPGKCGPEDPRRILLMTFTDHAAAELRTRVTELILKARHEAEAGGNGEEVETIVRVLRQLPAAPICTIHSFCAGFLRERALDAGVSPGFSVLDRDEADALIEDGARTELLARLNREPRPEKSEAPPYDPDFDAFCAGVRVLGGEYGAAVTDVVQNLLRQAASKGLALDDAEAMLPPPEHSITRDDFAAVLDAMKNVRAGRKAGLPERAEEVFQALEKNLHDFPSLGKPELIERFTALLLDSGNPNFRGAGLTEISTRLKELIGEVQTVARYRGHFQAIRAFARYAGAVARRYADRKQELSALDFDDLLLKTRAMLNSRPAGIKPFDFIIVDEVQDTSRVQSEIIEQLWDPANGRLAICGDTKQSIYAWRNADPRVMPDLEREIEKTGAHRKVALRASFRSKDSILDFINLLFQQVYGESYTEEERLVPAQEKNAILRRGGKEKPCVELLIAPWEMESSTLPVSSSRAGDKTTGKLPELETRVRSEMEAVARRIKLLVDGPGNFQPSCRYSDESERFEPAGPSNKYRYSDILILLRRTTNQQALEHVLRIQGIPYRIGGRGKGLFTRPEVIDALLFFKVLTHPFDTIALIGFLRSPWIGLSDDSIFQLGWRDVSFDEALFAKQVSPADAPASLPIEQAQRLGRARQIIDDFRAKADVCLASELLRGLVRQTGYDAIIAGTFRGAQRVANLRKLIDWVRRTERGGTVLLADVVKTLEKYVDTPPDISEAALLDPDQNAVTIMTIHGAKGLTERVVFVPELSSRPSGDSPWAMLDGPAGTTPRLYLKTEDIAREETRTPGFEKAREAAREVRATESKNVFYVALTRARDLVVLSGARGDQKPAEWRAEIEKLISESEEARELLRRIPYAGLEAAAAQLSKESATPETDTAAMGPLLEMVTRRYPAPIPSPRLLRFPATVLSAYHNNPEDYAKTKLASFEPFLARPRPRPGEAELDGDDVPPPRDTDEVGSTADFGTAGHEVLEQMALNGWRGDLAAMVEAAGCENHLSDGARADLNVRLAGAVEVMSKKMADANSQRVEWPFALMLERGETKLIVDGTVDVLFRAADGAWNIIDYKFSDEPAAMLKKKYGLQLNLYRLAVARLQEESRQPIHASLVAIGRQAVTTIGVLEDPGCPATAIHAAESLDALFRTGLS